MILAVLCGVPAIGQEFRSTITGRVIDAQQAVVPGVKVICTNIATGAKYATVSGADGAFTVPSLTPGQYSLSAEAAGFKAYLRKDFEVTANQRMQLDIALEVGQVTDTGTVTSEGDLRADAANNYDFSAIKQFPIHERLSLQYRCEWFNAFNHPVFSGPSTSPTSSAFATISAVDNLARVIQMGLRLTW